MSVPLGNVCRLLLVEDSDDEVLFFGQAVQNIPGVRIVGRVTNGQEAIEYLSGKGRYADQGRYPRPDIVVLEIRLPTHSGLELLKWMQGRRNMPTVVIFSRSELEEEKKQALKMGAVLYQHKTTEAEVVERFLHWVKQLWQQGPSKDDKLTNIIVLGFSAWHTGLAEQAAAAVALACWF
jgi:CheY-like chemotaxis protein